MLDITVIQGTQGCGKTTVMRKEALDNAGRYVFSCPSIELIREQVDWLRRTEPALTVYESHTDSAGRMPVAQKIDHAKCAVDNAGLEHAFLFISHEALMSYDFTGFAGWHMRIDEAPAVLQSGVMDANLTKAFIQGKVKSEERVGDWGYYASAEIIKWTDVGRDTMAKNALSFLKQANRPSGLFINEKALADNDEFVWFSFWSPTYLGAFASVKISASGYFTSLGYKATKHFYGDRCTFTVQNIPSLRTAQPAIEIFYMTDTHKGSTSFWDTSEGRKCLVEVCDYIGRRSPDLGFWSGNDVVHKLMEHRLRGEYIPPKAMGLNKFREKKSCAFIYSSKNTPNDRAIVEFLDVSQADILADREMEDIRQFIMRGAIRSPDYDGSYLIYLYEKDQADQLQRHLSESGFTQISVAPASVPYTASHVRTGYSKPVVPAADKKARRREMNRTYKQRSRQRERERKTSEK